MLVFDAFLSQAEIRRREAQRRRVEASITYSGAPVHFLGLSGREDVSAKLCIRERDTTAIGTRVN